MIICMYGVSVYKYASSVLCAFPQFKKITFITFHATHASLPPQLSCFMTFVNEIV